MGGVTGPVPFYGLRSILPDVLRCAYSDVLEKRQRKVERRSVHVRLDRSLGLTVVLYVEEEFWT